VTALQSFTNCCRRIEVEYGRDGFHGDVGVTPALYAIFRERDRLRPVRLGIADSIWDKGPPGIVVQGIAMILPEHPELVVMFREAPEWVGLALAIEAWMVHADKVDELDELAAIAGYRLLSLHPDRVTIRAVYGVTREQDRVAVVHEEGKAAEVSEEAHYSGTILDGLVALTATLDDLLDNT
jgi:hypothetical protein